MTDDELAAIDERITKLERLVRLSICKCEIGPYWVANHGCLLHSGLTPQETAKAVGELKR